MLIRRHLFHAGLSHLLLRYAISSEQVPCVGAFTVVLGA